MRARLLPLLLTLLLASGCPQHPLTPGETGTKKKDPSPKIAASPGTAPQVLPAIAPGTLPSGVPVVSNNGASLAGTVLAPAPIVGNNGGNYRLLAAVTQVPVPNAPVRVLDAAGTLLAEGTTRADGSYGFSSALPEQHLVVEVTLPNRKGVVQAIAPKGAKQADADLYSTLTTGYILSQYVKNQQDPVATLAKLPPEVEQETRAKAKTALEGGSAAVPDALTTEKVVETVTTLRSQDATFDTQMEAVKKLLIAAGQSNLGAGQVATQVTLKDLRTIHATADGAVYMAATGDRRIWRLRPDGRIETLAGLGNPDTGSLEGKAGPEAGYGDITSLYPEPGGSWLIAELDGRITRLGADGKVTQVLKGNWPYVALPGPDGTLYTVGHGDLFQPPTLLQYHTDGRRTVLHDAQGTAVNLDQVRIFGKDSRNRLYLGILDYYLGAEVFRYDLAGKQMARLKGAKADGLAGVSVDGAGNLFMLDAARKLTVLKPDGQTLTLAASLPEGFTLALEPVTLVSDTVAYLGQAKSRLYKVENGTVTHVAGALTTGGTAENLALQTPAGIAIAANGDLFVADDGLKRIVRIRPDRSVSVVAGTGEAGFTGDGGPATAARLGTLHTLRLDPQGNLYMLVHGDGARTRIRKVAPDGTITTVYTSAERKIRNLVVGNDGTVYFDDWAQAFLTAPTDATFKRLNPDGTATALAPQAGEPQTSYGDHLGLGFDGGLYAIAHCDTLQKWTPEGGWQTVKRSAKPVCVNIFDGGFTAWDRQGRFYTLDRDQVKRWDPVADTFTAIAGAGTSHFAGAGVDDSLLKPSFLAIDATGNLFISDTGHKQVKRIAADQL